MSKRALIIQGGGFRSVFSAGVLDAFMAANYNPFHIYAGVSGGANAMTYYLASDYKSCIQSIRVLQEDKRFMNYQKLLQSGVLMNVDFFHQIANEIVPLSYDRIVKNHSDKIITVVATDRKTGEAVYLRPSKENWVSCLVASCTVPFLTKGQEIIDGKELMDGAWSDPLPIQWAIEQGATEIVIVRTMPEKERVKQSISDRLGELYYGKHPGLKTTFAACHKRLNDTLDFIDTGPEGIKIVQIAPDTKLTTNRPPLTRNSIDADYRLGVEKGMDYLKSTNGSI